MPAGSQDKISESTTGLMCAYCKKTGLDERRSVVRMKMWGAPTYYCSTRCFARGERRLIAVLSVCLIPMYIIMGFVVQVAITSNSDIIDPFLQQVAMLVSVTSILILIIIHLYYINMGREHGDRPSDEWDGTRSYKLVE